MEVRRIGERALLVECPDQAGALATYAAILEHGFDAVDVVPAARTVLLDGLADPAGVFAALVSWPEPDPVPLAAGEEVLVPVTYDGADLDEVARQWDLSVREVIALHLDTSFVVAFCGFAPGFAYLTGTGRTVRRRSDPRPAVPAGSVALAGEYSAIYPGASPGGWQLIGRTELPVWRPGAEPPALLTPGTRVRFVDD